MTNSKLQTYNQKKHGISSEDIAPSALAIIYKLLDAGYQAYIVGGAVRDLLLGFHPKDFDIATNATPDEVKHVFDRHCRLIGRRFRLAHVYHNREMYEVATFRGTSSQGERIVKRGHILKDNVFGTIEQDALRRDFTCNSLYFDIENNNILDYCHGVKDTLDRRLVFIGDAVTRIIEDPIRMIRAVRFQAKLNLTLSDAIIQGILQQHKTLEKVSYARLFDELVKLFHSGHSRKAYVLLKQLKLFGHIFQQSDHVIKQNPSYDDLIQSALKSTDSRIASKKSVTPIFLFACFLWPVAETLAQLYIKKGSSAYDAYNKAANKVFSDLRQTLAIPRLVQIGIRNIWLMQLRLMNNRGKRVFYTLEQPRFRAAYDFFLLRSLLSPELADIAQWWTTIQTLSKTKQKEFVYPKKKRHSSKKR